MQGVHCQSAPSEEWSALMGAVDRVRKDIAAYEHGLVTDGEIDIQRTNFN